MLKQSGKKKVLVIAPNFPSINQPWIDTYLEQLLLQDFDITIYTNNIDSNLYHAKVDILNLRSYIADFSLKKINMIKSVICCVFKSPLFFFRSIPRIMTVANELKTDYSISKVDSIIKQVHFLMSKTIFADIHAIHSHEEISGFHFTYLSKIMNIPLVMTFHGLPPSGVGQLSINKRRMLYDLAETVFVNSKFAMQQVIQLGCNSKKVQILPQGLPIDDFPFHPRIYPDSGDATILLTVGRFHKDKGHAYALLAAKRLINSGLKLHYHIVGVGPQRQYLKKIINKLNLNNYVTIHEGISHSELIKLYKTAHIFILPSINNIKSDHVETQGVVLQEAQATGCLIVATHVGGIPECLHHGKDAILVQDKSSREISSAIKKLLDDKKLWESFQCNGRKNVENNFSASVIGDRMAMHLTKIINHHD